MVSERDGTGGVPEDLIRRHALTRTGPPGARPVLLVHGFGCDQTAFDPLRAALCRLGDVVGYDLMGSGASWLPDYDFQRYASLDGHVDDLLAIVRRLDLRDVLVVAHSVGAMISLLASVAEPERFDSLCLIGASPCYRDLGDYHGGFSSADLDSMLDLMDADYRDWATDMAPRVMGRPDRPQLGADLTRRFLDARPAIARHFTRTTFLSDHRADMPYVRVPTLLLQARDDMVVPLGVGRWLHETIPGSTLRVMDAVGHCPHLSAPAETLRLVLDHVARMEGRVRR